MILRALSALWTSVAPAMADHLWQSTLFLVLAAILVLALRKNQARVRYWVWLTGSVKFLIPFSLLIALGSHLAKPRVSTPAQAVVYSAVEDFSQPFAAPELPLISQAPAPVSRFHLLPPIIVAIWLAGIVVVLLVWATSWIRVSRMVRRAVPIGEGPEFEALCRLESSFGIRKPVRLVLSRNWMEPGIFGVFRPVLIWPEGISHHLDDRHVEAILGHEICHARRHDNLTAVLHMLVEAVFWFHPLVWWMGARLEEERERACDEEVSLLCNQPHVYAQSILRVCKFCSESPLSCVSGITGADLKKRIVQIMTERMVLRLTLPKKLMLATFGVCAVAAPIVLGLSWPLRALAGEGQSLMHDWVQRAGGRQEFEVASVREDKSGVAGHANFVLGPGNAYASTGGRFTGTDLSLVDYIRFAYKLTDGQTDAMAATAPKWIADEKFDVEAKSENHNPTKDQMRLMMQSLLAGRFKLKVHTESREMPVLAMVLVKPGKLGPQLRAHPADGPPCSNLKPNGSSKSPAAAHSAVVDGGYPLLCGGLTDAGAASVPSHVRLGARDVPLTLLVSNLGGFGRPLVDRTGLTGTYDFYFEWGADPRPGSDAPAHPGDPGTTVEEALRDQLGIKLERQRAMVDVLVIDHVEMPASLDGAEVPAQAAGVIPVAMGQAGAAAQAAQPERLQSFEVATIKPASGGRLGMEVLPGGRVKLTNYPLYWLVAFAYGIPYQSPRMTGGPDWMHTQAYDIEAKAPDGAVPGGLTDKERDRRIQLMMQTLLKERFKLSVRKEVKDVPVYGLAVGKNGPKLAPSKATEQDCAMGKTFGGMPCHEFNGGQGRGLHGAAVSIPDVAKYVENWADRPVIDNTGLTGLYAIDTEGWVPMRQSAPRDPNASGGDEAMSDPLRSTLFTVFQGLGLKLEAGKAPVEVFVIDHVERPSEN